jgi:hypothetical protein
MPWAAILAVMAVLTTPSFAQKPDAITPPRFGVDVDFDAYPQATAKEALQSALKAGDAGRFDYLVAHLSDPAYADKQVKEAGSFEKFVATVKSKWSNDPESVKELRRFASDGTWEESGDTAVVKLKDVKARQVFLKKVGNRWFLENRQKAQREP